MINVIKPILPEMILFFGGCTILLLDVFQRVTRHLMEVTLGILIVALLVITCFSSSGLTYEGLFLNSSFTNLIKAALICLTLFQFLSASSLMDKYNINQGEHTVMVLFMLVGLSVMVSSNHFIMLYVGMEIQALAAYTLTVMQRKSTFAAEAGVKYFILGSLASVIFLFGVSYIYGAFGTLYFHEVAAAKNLSLQPGLLGAILVLSAFLFKVGLFPLHQWVPDVYQGAPTPSVSILSTLSKVGAIAVLLEVIAGPFFILFKKINIESIITVIAAASMIIGAILPIAQTHIKRLLGYSAIGHVGFIMMGLWGLVADGMGAVIAYILIYSLTLMMTFICLMSIKDKATSPEECDDIMLVKLEGLAQIRPKHAFILAVCFLSMAGVPPLVGFFPKLLLIQHALNKGGLFIVSIAIVTTVAGLFYYLKLVKLMYIDIPTKQSVGPSNKVNTQLLVVFLPALIVQLIGCYIPVLQSLYKGHIAKAAQSLFIGSNEKNHP